MILNPNRRPKSLSAAVRGSLLVPVLIVAMLAGVANFVQLLQAASPDAGQSWHYETIQTRQEN